jgi:hypothetical protein
MAPPVLPSEGIAEPVASTPTGLDILIGVVPAPGASVTWTFATTPGPIPLEFMPVTRHVIEPDPELHEMDFPAAADAEPVVELIATTRLAG